MQKGLSPALSTLYLCVVAEKPEGYLGCKLPPFRSMGSLTYVRIPNPEQQRQEEEHV